MGPVGLLLVAASVVFYGPLTQVPGWFALLPTLGAVALILGGFAQHAPVTQLMATGPMVWIGKISYPLYLVHWPIRIFLQEHTLEFTLGWRLVGFILSFVAAAGVYYIVEVPIRRGRILAGRRLYVVVVVGLSVATISASALIMRNDGVAGRFVPEVAEILEFRNDTAEPFQQCDRLAASVDALCALGDDTALREVIVIGDSHALALSGAMDIWLSDEGRGGALLFAHGCMPVLGAGRDRCQQLIDGILDLVERSPEVTEVVMVSIWRQAVPDGGKPFDGLWVPEGEVAEVFTSHLSETVERLQAAGKRVTIVEPLFAAARRVPETRAANIAFDRDWPVNISLAEHRATFVTVSAAFDELDNVRRVSLIEPFCEDGTCYAIVDGVPLFSDGNHLAFGQSGRIAYLLKE
jgi:hypothetical protein